MTGNGGDNEYTVTADMVTIAAQDGNNTITADGATDATITAGDGDNEITALGNGSNDVTITTGDGDNEITATGSENVDVTTGDGNSEIDVSGSAEAVVTTGSGDDTIFGINTIESTVDAGAGDDTMTLSGEDITVSAAEGDDTLTVAGTAGGLTNAGAAGLNLMLILDDSGSMSGARTTALKSGLNDLFDDLEAKGVNTAAVTVVFTSGAQATPWGDLGDARTAVNGLTASGGTDYDTAILTAEGGWGQTGKIVGATNVSLFVSDATDGLSDASQTRWENFLTNEGIESLAVGLDVGGTAGGLADVAFDGTTGQQIDPILTDADGLAAVLQDVSVDLTGNAGRAAVVNIDLGEGENILNLGDGDQLSQGLTAMEGSSISGDDITLTVNADSDLRAADLTGANITSVVLDDAAPSASRDADNAMLTLFASQFDAIGAENFSVEGSVFNTHAFVDLIVDEDLDLSSIDVGSLPRNIDLRLEIQDEATLTLTAEQLHKWVGQNGITIADDGNTDVVSGKVYITDAGQDFDPFNTSDSVNTVIDGTTYFGGSLSSDFNVDGEWFNVLLDRTPNGYDRPADDPSASRMVVDTDTQGGELGPFSTTETFLRFVGDSDLEFVPVEGAIDEWGQPIEAGSAIELGMQANAAGDSMVPTNDFIVDFSSVNGDITNLAFANFENAEAIFGNGSATRDVRINVEIGEGEAVASADAGLVSQGVQTYVVTDIPETDNPGALGADTAQFWTSRVTQNLETLGLQGNYDDTITFGNTRDGVEFLLETEFDKFSGYTVGTLNGVFSAPGASAVVNVVALDAVPDGEEQRVAGIELTNAESVTINVEGGDTVVEAMEAPGAESLTIVGDGDVTIGAPGDADASNASTDLPSDLTEIDTTGVVGVFTATIDGVSSASEFRSEPFSFTGGDGGSVLYLEEFPTPPEGTLPDPNAHSIDGGAGGVDLFLGGEGANVPVDLSTSTLTNVTSITLTESSNATITQSQFDAVGAANIGLGETTDDENLTIVDVDGAPFDSTTVADEINLSIVMAEDADITLDPSTDLSNVSSIDFNGANVTMSVEQLLQLVEGLEVEDVADLNAIDLGDGALNLTGLTQAQAETEYLDPADPSTTLFNFSDLLGTLGDVLPDFSAGTLELAESVSLVAPVTNDGLDFDIILGDGLTFGIATEAQANGLVVNGGTDSTVDLLFTSAAAAIDAQFYDITTLRFPDTLVAGSEHRRGVHGFAGRRDQGGVQQSGTARRPDGQCPRARSP